MHKLTVAAVNAAKSGEAPRKLTDGGGLYLLIRPQGGKYWRYDYRFAGKRKTLAIGVYPAISLSEARNTHMRARAGLLEGIDPAEAKKIHKLTQNLAQSDTFEAIATEWFSQKISGKSENYRVRTWRILSKDLFPRLGNRAIGQITAPEALSVLKKIESRTVDIAHRAKQLLSLIYRYAIATGRAQNDPTDALSEALTPRRKKHHASITDPAEFGGLLRDIEGFEGTVAVKAALQLSALLFQRPGEIRHMEWSEINWDERRWEIPASKMKMRSDHVVPLARQAVDILAELYRFTGSGVYVFPSARGASRPLSDNGVRTALRTMGYDKEKMSPHGFRATARTLLDEKLRYRVDIIEHQLSHAVRDATGRAYNRTTHLEERVTMMQAWADYLDKLRYAETDGQAG